MKRVLLIAYYFPPDGGAGTQRALKFAKYLPEFGWLPTVLTRSAPRKRGVWDPEDSTLSLEIPESVSVVRVEASPPGWRLLGTGSDLSREWARAFLREGRQLLLNGSFAAIMVTMSPFGMANVGRRLRELSGVPLILDLRDPWALDGWRSYSTKFHWRQDYRIMCQSLSTANGVIANTHEAERQLKKLAASGTNTRWVTIPNGYDEEDFLGAKEEAPEVAPSRFTVVHAGTLHSQLLYRRGGLRASTRRYLEFRPEPICPAGRTEYFLYTALNLLRKRNNSFVRRLRFICVGAQSEENMRCVREFELEDCVEFTGYLSHRESVRWLLKAHALFLPLHALPSGRRSLIVPGKTYEYLAARRPVIAALPEGDARDLLAQSGLSYLAYPDNASEIADALEACHSDWEAGNVGRAQLNLNEEWLAAFERRKLTSKLAEFLDVVGK